MSTFSGPLGFLDAANVVKNCHTVSVCPLKYAVVSVPFCLKAEKH